MDPPIYNPTIPNSFAISGGFRAGRIARIQGRINPNANSFIINLQCGPNAHHDDIALHLNARFNENAVVRNGKQYSSWGVEERHGGHFPFARGQHFEIMILAEPQQFKVAVNGSHFTEFNHRLPLERITHIGIEGDITVSLIQFDGSSSPMPPAYNNNNNVGFNPSAPSHMSAGAPPYPMHNSNLPPMGFVPAAVPAPYGHSAPPTAGYPPPSHQQPPYGSPHPHQPPPPMYGAHSGPYPAHQGYPQGQPGGYAQPGAYPSSPSGHTKSGGLLDSAGKLLAGGLAGAGLATLANKIPGQGGHYPQQQHGHYPQGPGGYPQQHGGQSHGSGGGILGGLMGPAAALGVGGMLAGKAGKKGKKKNKLLQYALPAAGLGAGGYMLSKGLKHKKHGFGHHGHSSSSSSSSSSEEE